VEHAGPREDREAEYVDDIREIRRAGVYNVVIIRRVVVIIRRVVVIIRRVVVIIRRVVARARGGAIVVIWAAEQASRHAKQEPRESRRASSSERSGHESFFPT
jgi:hypothetical protein